MCVCVFCQRAFELKKTQKIILKNFYTAAGPFLDILLLLVSLRRILLSFFVDWHCNEFTSKWWNNVAVCCCCHSTEHFLNKFSLIQQQQQQQKRSIILCKYTIKTKLQSPQENHLPFCHHIFGVVLLLLRWCYFIGKEMRIVSNVPFG